MRSTTIAAVVLTLTMGKAPSAWAQVPPTLASATAIAAESRETTGTPGSPGATTTIDGRYLPPPPQPFTGQVQLNA